MTNQAMTCVLLAQSEHRLAARGELDRRGWTAHEAGHPLPAMAELCLLDRMQAITGVEDGAEQLALVVVEPCQWPQLSTMLAAARRYVPKAALWAYRDGELTLIPHEDASGAGSGSGLGLSANDAPPATYEPSSRASSPGDAPPPQISADEIDMLLDDDQGDRDR